MSKDLEKALKNVLKIMEEHDLTADDLVFHIKEYEKIYTSLKGKQPNQVYYVDNNNHKMLELVKDGGDIHYRNLVGSKLKADGFPPTKPRKEVFHINEEGKEISYVRKKGYNSLNIGADQKRKIGIEIEEPINKNLYKKKQLTTKKNKDRGDR